MGKDIFIIVKSEILSNNVTSSVAVHPFSLEFRRKFQEIFQKVLGNFSLELGRMEESHPLDPITIPLSGRITRSIRKKLLKVQKIDSYCIFR